MRKELTHTQAWESNQIVSWNEEKYSWEIYYVSFVIKDFFLLCSARSDKNKNPKSKRENNTLTLNIYWKILLAHGIDFKQSKLNHFICARSICAFWLAVTSSPLRSVYDSSHRFQLAGNSKYIFMMCVWNLSNQFDFENCFLLSNEMTSNVVATRYMRVRIWEQAGRKICECVGTPKTKHILKFLSYSKSIDKM